MLVVTLTSRLATEAKSWPISEAAMSSKYAGIEL